MQEIKPIPDLTEEWFKARLGAFTSSRCISLFGSGKRSMTDAEIKQRDLKNKAAKALDPKAKSDTRTTVDTLFGSSAMTYINEKASEIINKKAKFVPVTKPMQRGLDCQSEAIEYYTKVTGRKVHESGYYPISPYYGGSPDGEIKSRRKTVGIIEIKCLNEDNHSAFCELTTVSELRGFDESFYCQAQMNMMVAGGDCKWCDVISWDSRAMGYDDNGEIIEDNFNEDKFVFAIHIIRVKRDEIFLSELKMRLDAAVDILVSKLEKRMHSADRIKKMYERTLKRQNKQLHKL